MTTEERDDSHFIKLILSLVKDMQHEDIALNHGVDHAVRFEEKLAKLRFLMRSVLSGIPASMRMLRQRIDRFHKPIKPCVCCRWRAFIRDVLHSRAGLISGWLGKNNAVGHAKIIGAWR